MTVVRVFGLLIGMPISFVVWTIENLWAGYMYTAEEIYAGLTFWPTMKKWIPRHEFPMVLVFVITTCISVGLAVYMSPKNTERSAIPIRIVEGR